MPPIRSHRPVVLTTLAVLLASVGLADEASGAASSPPNILAIVVDTLRADALGLYGQKLPTSPNLDAFAKRAIVYDRAWTQYTWTVPSFVSYMSSRFARTHGWTYPMGELDKYGVLDERAPMLPQVLQKAGYATAGHYANEVLRADLGLDRGFSIWLKGADAGVTRAAIADVGRWKEDGKPNFLYVHMMAPHLPLKPSASSLAAVGYSLTYDDKTGLNHDHVFKAPAERKEKATADLRAAYLACVRDADANIGRILAAVEASGQASNTVIAIWSDHGELLGEHDLWGHHSYIWEGVTRVPLLLSVPGEAPRRVTDRVGRSVDIAPTLLALAGQPTPSTWQGGSLLAKGPAPLAVVERDAKVSFSMDGRFKTLEDRSSGAFLQAYDLDTDAAELKPIKDAGNPLVAGLAAAAKAWRGKTPQMSNTGPLLQLEAKERDDSLEALRALGYVE